MSVTRSLGVAAVLSLAGTGCAQAQDRRPNLDTEPIIGLPCEGCEAVYEGLPGSFGAVVRIAPKEEPGEAMTIEGTVRDAKGRPAPGVIVYAYHTDAQGEYPRDEQLRGAAARHGRLRGWAQTDEQGRYAFHTIRPASYPSRTTPAHLHMHVIEPGCCTYYLASIHFTDDPLLSGRERRALASGRGSSGLVRPERDPQGVWQVTRDIVLGERIPDYPR